jgi:2-keto-4-pentenoate hydratase/2-oxohepta-3-ene-1,7-dioic acid hydratase in catechol pathway
MKFATYRRTDGSVHAGVIQNDQVFDITPAGYATVQAVIESGRAHSIDISALKGEFLSGVQLLAPLPKPSRIFGIGLNYQEHATESQMTVQAVPTVFLKLSSSVTGPDTDIILPQNSEQPDYEAELGVVINKPGYRIPATEWGEHVFGYTIINDISARDIQLATSQWNLAKSFPTFAPLGPWIVTKDEIADPHALGISLTIDGETLQDSNTKHLIFKVPQLIEYISSLTPLEAGDVISTGTPAGVGMGRSPQRWLKAGEEIAITIECIGVLRNRTKAEGANA